MAPSIAGVFWRDRKNVVRCLPGGGECSRAATLKYLVSANDYDVF